MQPEHLSSALQELLGAGYTVGRELQGGGMSRVFVARERALKRDVVIKVLPPDLLSESAVARFRREIEITANLQHPHILPVISAGGDSRLLYYISPYIRGESLRDRIREGNLPAFAESRRMAVELLNAVAFAHAHGVIHRDIKPGNVLLSGGHAILADFGIARAVSGDATEAHDGPSVSTLDSSQAYAAPENPRGEARDLYAVAVVIHELLTGFATTAGVAAGAMAAAIRTRHPTADPEAVRSMATALSRAIAVDPVQRFGSAVDFRAALSSEGRPGILRRFAVPVGIAAAAVAAVLLISRERVAHPPITAVVQPESVTGVIVMPDKSAPPDTTPPSVVSRPEVSPPEHLTQSSSGGAVSSVAELPDGHEALRRGELNTAQSRFTLALASTPTDARAQLGLALATAWNATPSSNEQALTGATRAMADSTQLDPRERRLAAGIMALSRGAMPDACAAFDSARRIRDDGWAWLGLAECRRRDDLVVQGADGPRFRSTYQQAARAYKEAIRRFASGAPPLVYRRLQEVVFTAPTLSRRGLTAEGKPFIGQSAAFGDTIETIVFDPTVQRRVTPELTAAMGKAAVLGRKTLLPVFLVWARNAPGSVEAHETLSMVLEQNGDITVSGLEGTSALQQIHRARSLASSDEDRLRLSAVEVRVLLRGEMFAPAAALADSILAVTPSDDPATTNALLPLALVTGKVSRATTLLEALSGSPARQVRGIDGRPLPVPAAIIAQRASFVVRSALGVCDDNVRREPQRLADLLRSTGVSPLNDAQNAFLERPMLLALPCIGVEVTSILPNPTPAFMRILRLYRPTDRQALVTELDAMDSGRERTPSTVNTEPAVAEASGRLALGDSTGALRLLRRSLDAIPLSTPAFLLVETQAATLPRAMAMVAALSDAAGDHETARRYARGVIALLRHADPELKPTVDAMQRIVGR